MDRGSLLPEHQAIALIDADSEAQHCDLSVVATRDHRLIRRWAAHRHAVPATGEATASGSATVSVNDGGAGVRFNFPGAGRFRPIDWDEWFGHFDDNALVFVYERDAPSSTPSSRYRLVKMDALGRVTQVR